MPIDVDPVARNVVEVSTVLGIATARVIPTVYTPHFTTCPNATSHRRRS